MYSFQILKNSPQQPTLVDKQRCKGIQRAAQKKLSHADYLEQLNRPAENFIVNRRIGSKLHQLYTWEGVKRALCAFDDKRFLLEDGVHSLAYGHHRITASVEDIPKPQLADNIVNTERPDFGDETAIMLSLQQAVKLDDDSDSSAHSNFAKPESHLKMLIQKSECCSEIKHAPPELEVTHSKRRFSSRDTPPVESKRAAGLPSIISIIKTKHST